MWLHASRVDDLEFAIDMEQEKYARMRKMGIARNEANDLRQQEPQVREAMSNLDCTLHPHLPELCLRAKFASAISTLPRNFCILK